MGSRQSRPIEIKIEMSRVVEMSFFKMLRISWLWRLTLKRCRDRDSWSSPCQKLRLIETLELCQDLSRCRFSNFVKICWDVVFQTVKNISTVETSFFKLSIIFWQLRLTFRNYSGRRLIGSLWAMSTLIPITEF